MMTNGRIRFLSAWSSGLAAGLMIGMGMVLGAVLVMQYGQQDPDGQALVLPAQLNASATDSAETFSIATGQIDESEGIFFLDFLTGELQCVVLYKNGNWGARFVANVFNDLQIQATKKPKFLMVTGKTEFARGGGGGQPGRCVLYVVDSTTGSFAVYGVPWNRQAEATGQPQGGPLVLLQQGRARNLQIREM
jgi:hypothetical protein